MVQQLRAHDAPAEDLNIPSTHVKLLTDSCKSSRSGFNILFWPLVTSLHIHMNMCVDNILFKI